MSVLRSPFGRKEWVSTKELVEVYGRTVDFWQKLSGKGAFDSKRNGLGPRAHLSINVRSFLLYWDSLKDGTTPCHDAKNFASSNAKGFGTRGKGTKVKNSKHPSIQRIRQLANREASAGYNARNTPTVREEFTKRK
jgi:hypothetical protein